MIRKSSSINAVLRPVGVGVIGTVVWFVFVFVFVFVDIPDDLILFDDILPVTIAAVEFDEILDGTCLDLVEWFEEANVDCINSSAITTSKIKLWVT